MYIFVWIKNIFINILM